MSNLSVPSTDPATVLCKATLRAAEQMGLTRGELGDILGVDRTSVHRLAKREQLDPETKQGELAILLLRVFRSLVSLLGDDPRAVIHWLRTPNEHLGDTPAQLLRSITGITQVVAYLDALRGQE